MREDSLEAPTRHPIDWQNPGFYDEAKLFDELDRVYDICHGCRRCVSLCGSFPTLFDLVDNSARFRSTATPDSSFAVRPGAKTPGKVAIFSTCYVNYNEPGIGHDLIRILKHNEIAHILVEKENCCGMPKLELGDLNAVRKLKDGNIPVLAWLAREGYAILTAVQEAMFDPFEYLVLRHKDGLLKTDLKQPLGKVSYHIPCHWFASPTACEPPPHEEPMTATTATVKRHHAREPDDARGLCAHACWPTRRCARSRWATASR